MSGAEALAEFMSAAPAVVAAAGMAGLWFAPALVEAWRQRHLVIRHPRRRHLRQVTR